MEQEHVPEQKPQRIPVSLVVHVQEATVIQVAVGRTVVMVGIMLTGLRVLNADRDGGVPVVHRREHIVETLPVMHIIQPITRAHGDVTTGIIKMVIRAFHVQPFNVRAANNAVVPEIARAVVLCRTGRAVV